MRAMKAKRKAAESASRAESEATSARAGMETVAIMSYVFVCFVSGRLYEQVSKNNHAWFQWLACKDKAVATVVEQSRHIMKASDFAMEVARERIRK